MTEDLDPAQVASLITRAQQLLEDPDLTHNRSVRIRNRASELKKELWQLNRCVQSLSYSLKTSAISARKTRESLAAMEWDGEDNGHES